MNFISLLSFILVPICVFSFPNGNITDPYMVPFMVAVIFRDKSGANGCLISDKHVLMYPVKGSLFGMKVELKSKTYKNNICSLWYKIVKVDTHPGFKGYERHGAMILTLEQSVAKTYKTKPVSLPTLPISRDWNFTFVSYGNNDKDGELALIETQLASDNDCEERNYNKEIHVCVELNPIKSDLGSFMIHEGTLYGWNFFIDDSRKTAAFYLAADSLDWIDSILNPTNKTTTRRTTTSTTKVTESTKDQTTVPTHEPETSDHDYSDDGRRDGARQHCVSTLVILISLLMFIYFYCI